MKKTLRSHARKARNRSQFFQSSAMRFNGMRLRDIPFALALAFGAVSSHAEPTGGAVAAGQAAISAINGVTTVQQMSDRAIVNWQSFNVNAGEAVKFVQPGRHAAILNRVTGGSVSNIDGLLQGNGRVYLINPNGIVVGANGVVNVNGGFVASTKGIADSAFMSGGALVFTGESTGSIQILGKVQSAQGDVILIAPKVAIEKTAELIAGQSIKLVAASEVELSNGKLTVKPKAEDAGQITVEGALTAAKVQLTANNNNLGALAINTNGNIRATGTQRNADGSVSIVATGEGGNINISGQIRSEKGDGHGGAVTVLADNGIRINGTINANSTDTSKVGGDIYIGRDVTTNKLARATDVSGATLLSNKGFVETSGDWLKTNNITVLAKDWLLDPTNIIISTGPISGTAYNANYSAGTDSVILAADIVGSLNLGTSVTIATTSSGSSLGNIAVNASIAKTSGGDATLTLKAHNNISLSNNVQITSNLGKLNIVLNSDLDGNGAGGIVMASGSGIVSNGGSIAFGGGVGGNASGNAQGGSGIGISFVGATVNAGSGTFVAKGQATTGNGVSFQGNNNITAANYDINGISNSGAAVYFQSAAGTSTFTSSVNGLVRGTSTTNRALFVFAGNNIIINAGTGTATMDSGGGDIRLGFSGGVTVKTDGNVTLGSHLGSFFSQAPTTVNSGILTIKGRGAGDGVGIQDGGGTPANINVNNGASLVIDGISTGAGDGIDLRPAGAVNSIIMTGTNSSGQKGSIVLKGESSSARGIYTSFANITSDGGDITLIGKSTAGPGAAINADGLIRSGNASAGGTVTLIGNVTGTGTGLGINNSGAIQGGAVVLNGTAIGAQQGVFSGVSGTLTAVSGSVSVTGATKSGTGVQLQGLVTAANGIMIDGTTESAVSGVLIQQKLTTTAGNIDITGRVTNSSSATQKAILTTANGSLIANNGNINLNADTLGLQDAVTSGGVLGGKVNIANTSSGTLILLGSSDDNGSTSPNKTLGITQSELNFISAKQLTVGNNNSGNLTVISTITTNVVTGDLNLISGSNIAINAGLNVGGSTGTKNLTLNAVGASSAVTQTNAIKARGLELLGANATYTLTNLGNAVSNLVGNAGAVEFNNNGALEIGKGSSGVATTGLTTKNAIKVQAATSVFNTAGISVNEALNTSGGGKIALIGTATGTAHRGVTVNANVGSASAGSIDITGTSISDTGILQTAGAISSKDKITLVGSGVLGVNLSSGSLNLLAGGASFAGADAILIQGTGTTNLGVRIDTALNNNSTDGNTIIQSLAGSLTGNGIGLNSAATIANASTAGDIKIEAKGNSGISSTLSGVRASITQNANRFVFLTTEGDGNITSADITNNGNKNVIIAAGNNLSAGNGGGGQVLAGGSVTQGGTGRLFVYSGNASDTGLLTSLSSGFSALKVTGDATQNTETNFAYNAGAGITGSTANAQVIFREKVTITNGLVGTSVSKTYGDLETQANTTGATALLVATKAKLKQEGGNSGSVEFYDTNAGGNNNIKISKAVIIDSLDGSLTSPITNTSGSHLRVGSYNYGPLTSTKYTIDGIAGDVKVNVNKLALTGNIIQGTPSIYGDSSLTPGSVSLTNKIAGDDLNSTVVIDIVGKTSTSGNLKAGTHTGIQSISSLTGDDAGNYTFENVKGDYTVAKKEVFVNAVATTRNFNGAQQLQADPVKVGFVGGDVVNIKGVAKGTAIGRYMSALALDDDRGADADNYDVKFTNAALVIDYGGVVPPNQPQRYVPLASDSVNLTPVTFAVGVAPSTASGDEADPNICYAWGQRSGGDVVVHTLLKPTYMGLRNAKTDTQEATSNSSGAASHVASQCGQSSGTNVAEADNI